MKTKVYVLLEDIDYDQTGVTGVYATKELLIKALLETKFSIVYANAKYLWERGEDVSRIFHGEICHITDPNGSTIVKNNYDNFESFFAEYIDHCVKSKYNGSVFEMEITNE